MLINVASWIHTANNRFQNIHLMKNLLIASVLFLITSQILLAQSAILDVTSSDQGILIPSMTKDQRNLIAAPAINLIIFQIDSTPGLKYFDGLNWKTLSAGFIIEDSDEDTRVSVEKNSDDDIIRFDIEGIEVARLDSSTFHLEAPGKSLFIGTNAGAADEGFDKSYPTLGNRNTFLGYEAGMTTDTGFLNTAVGHFALKLHTLGSRNTAIGATALLLDEIGDDNTAVGYGSLLLNTSGDSNTAVGSIALAHNIIGKCNTAVGYRSGYWNTSGNYNTTLGYRASYNNSIGHSNVAIGTASLYHNDSCSNIVAVGDSALFNNGIGTTEIDQALFNTAVGSKTMYFNTIGNSNTALGYEAGYSNVSGDSNTYIGHHAGYNNQSGKQNVFIGNESGAGNLGSGNIFIGWAAGSQESGYNRLYIANSNTSNPLIYGEFQNNLMKVNGHVNITEFIQLDPRSSAPTTPTKGTIYYDMATDKLKVWTGTIWEDLN